MNIFQGFLTTITICLIFTSGLSSSWITPEPRDVDDEETLYTRNPTLPDSDRQPSPVLNMDFLTNLMTVKDCEMCLLLVRAKKLSTPNIVIDSNAKLCRECKQWCGRCKILGRMAPNEITTKHSGLCDTCSREVRERKPQENDPSIGGDSGSTLCIVKGCKYSLKFWNPPRCSEHEHRKVCLATDDTGQVKCLSAAERGDNVCYFHRLSSEAQERRRQRFGHKMGKCKTRDCNEDKILEDPPRCNTHRDRKWCKWCSDWNAEPLRLALPSSDYCHPHNTALRREKSLKLLLEARTKGR